MADNELDAISEHIWHVSFRPDNILLLQTPSAFRIYIYIKCSHRKKRIRRTLSLKSFLLANTIRNAQAVIFVGPTCKG